MSRAGAAAGPLRGLRGGARGGAEVPATRGPIWRSVRCAATARDPTPPRRSPSWHGPRHCGRRYRSASHRSLSASPDRPADRARRRLGATSCTVICILDPTRARARAWWRRRRPGAARCPLSTMLHLPPRFASLCLASRPPCARVGIWTRLHPTPPRRSPSGWIWRELKTA